MFKEHFSFLNKAFLSWLVKKENEKKVKMHSTVLNSLNGPMITIHSTLNTLNSLVEMHGQTDYKICNNNHVFNFSFRYRTQFLLLTYNVATCHSYTIPTPWPPLNT